MIFSREQYRFLFAKISSHENISNSLFAKISSRENKVLYSILFTCIHMHVLACLQVVVAFVAVLACCVDARKTEEKPQEMLWRDEKEVPKSCWMYYTEVNIYDQQRSYPV